VTLAWTGDDKLALQVGMELWLYVYGVVVWGFWVGGLGDWFTVWSIFVWVVVSELVPHACSTPVDTRTMVWSV
jgi:hypothetical protein